MKRLKNWLINKLGGLTEKDIEELVTATEELVSTATAFNDRATEVIKNREDAEKRYRIALQMYNESQTVEHAMRVIKAYCEDTDCTSCGRCNIDGCAFAHTPPCYWRP